MRTGVEYDHNKAIRDHKNPFTLKEQYLLKNNNQYILLYLDELDLSDGFFSHQIPPKIHFFPNCASNFDPSTFFIYVHNPSNWTRFSRWVKFLKVVDTFIAYR